MAKKCETRTKILEDAIEAFRQQRLADAEYLAKVSEIADSIRTRRGAGVPQELENRVVAQAFFGVLNEVLGAGNDPRQVPADKSTPFDVQWTAKAALGVDSIIQKHKIVNWTNNADVQNQMKNAIEDFLQEVEPDDGALSFEAIDLLLVKCLDMSEKG